MRPAAIVLAAALLGVPAVGPVVAQQPSPAEPAQPAPPEKVDPPLPAPDGETGAAEDRAAAGDSVGVPAKVWAVRIAGGWEADGLRGFSRVIGTFEGDHQKLTVQWLAAPDGRVINEVVLDDEEAAKLTFGDMRAEPEDRGGVTVFLDTLPDRDGLRDTWVLIIGAPGEARFGPATN